MLKEKAWKYFCQLSHGIVMLLVGTLLLAPIFLFPPTGLLIIPVGFIGLIAASLVLHGIIKAPLSFLKLSGLVLTAMFRDSSSTLIQQNAVVSNTPLLPMYQQSLGATVPLTPPYQSAAGPFFREIDEVSVLVTPTSEQTPPLAPSYE